MHITQSPDHRSRDRLVGLSVNIGRTPYEGGTLQIPERETGRVIADVTNTRPGDAVLFRLDERVEPRARLDLIDYRPMTRDVDSLTSATLKNLRDRWWDAAFTAFLKDTLQPKAGQRILDVGCGTGTAEVQLSRLRLTQVQLVAVDLLVSRVAQARAAAQSHNFRAEFSAADACALPFTNGAFDSAFCIAVLQHIGDVPKAVRELARVTRPEGRIVAVEPDNAGRYFYSSLDVGMRAYESAGLLFASLARTRGDSTDPSVGPKLSTLFAQNGIEPLDVHLFPVSRAQLGAPSAAMWETRRSGVQAEIDRAPDESIRRLGQDYLKLLDRYATEASAAGSAFVEIQNTMLFATVGQRAEP